MAGNSALLTNRGRDGARVQHKAVRSTRAGATAVISKASTDAAVAPPAADAARCHTCWLANYCAYASGASSCAATRVALQPRRTVVRKGEAVFKQDEPLQALYFIRRGSFKTRVVTPSRRAHVVGFCLPGDLLGIDGIAEGRYAADAVALEPAELCAIPVEALCNLCRSYSDLQHRLLRHLSHEIVRAQKSISKLQRLESDARLAACLADLFHGEPGGRRSGNRFRLPMTRRDLAEHLGLALETVSRAFSRLAARGVIDVSGRTIRVRNPRRLQSIVSSALAGTA